MENIDSLKNSIKSKIAISKFKEENIAMKKNYLTKSIVAACVCIVLTSGIVFAKDIEKIVKNLFSNSSEAINQAVENGYVQNIEEDYIYDKDIGIKVDNLVLDELNLNVSFKFETQNNNIKSIRFNKFIISTDTGEKIYDSNQQYVTSIDDVYTAQSVNWSNQPQKITDNIFSDSILFTLGERSKEKNKLYFKIQSLDITYQDDTKEEVYGNWNFDVKITEEMKNNQTISYKLLENNEHIENCTGVLYPTGLKIKFNLKEPLNPIEYTVQNSGKINGIGFFYLKNNSDLIWPSDIDLDNTYKEYILHYDVISIFSKIPENIEIYLEPYDSTITLIKEK